VTAHPVPTVAITMGDPAGIGPEIAVASARDAGVRAVCRPVLVGDSAAIPPCAGPMEFVPFDPTAAGPGDHLLEIVEVGALRAAPELGRDRRETGAAAFAYVHRAISGVRGGLWTAVATAPVSKAAWHLAGLHYPGHTEVFAEAFAKGPHAMLLTSPRINVGLCTLHQPLATVSMSLRLERVVAVGRLMRDTLSLICGKAPRLAVLGLNPHAGEGGLLGHEDLDVVAPAVAQLRAEGIDAEGPLPPDSAFTPASLARYDGHVCLYHDQGLIPFKMLAFEDGVNMTMGLSGCVRTSPDHGTAYGIAGKGVADPRSMIAAVKLAAALAP
jgi:4-hydroxythreonine-4-phosphate dehydrogenase